MKLFIVILCLFFVSVQIKAQTRQGCPDVCPAVYQPVCGETLINGKLVRCEFGNSCRMGISSCRHRISWCDTPLEKCVETSPICTQFR